MRSPQPRRVIAACLQALSILALSIFGPSLNAANGSWLSGQTGTQNWADGANWTGGIIPGSTSGSTNADTATFGSNTGAAFITIDAGRIIRTMTFNGQNTAGLYTLGSAGINLGEALSLSSGGNMTMPLNTTTALTVHAPLILQPASSTTAGTYTITNNSTSATNVNSDTNTYKINLLGDITGGTTSSTITLTLGGTAGNRTHNPSANVLSGLVSDGGAAGGLGISVTGPSGGSLGAWTITNAANSYTGPTTIGNGTLIVDSMTNAGVNSAIGAGSVINLNSNAQFKYTGSATSTDRSIISNGGVFYASGSGDVTLTGTIQLNGNLTFRGGRAFHVDTVITGSGGISRTDSGVVNLNRINTFSGDVGISDGAFRIASIADVGVDSPLGSGNTIRLSQSSGTVGRLEFTGLSGGSSNRDFTLSNGAGASSGNGRINNTVAGQTLALSGTVRATSSTAAHVSKLNLTGVGDGLMSGVIGGTVASPATATNTSLVKDGTGTWALSNANNYYGGTTISAGTLLVLNTTGSATGTGDVILSGTGALGGTGIVTASAGRSITMGETNRLIVGTTHGQQVGTAGPAGTSSAPGQLTLGSMADVALTLAGNLQFDLFGSSSDRLVLQTTAPTVTLGGTLTVADAAPRLLQAGSWQLIDWSGIGTATLAGGLSYDLPTFRLASGYEWNTSAVLTTGIISIEKTALNHTWTGAVDNSWANAGNWEAGTVPSASTDVFFNAGTQNLSHLLNADKSVRDMFFSGESNHTISRGSGGVLYAHGSIIQVLGGTQRFTVAVRPRNGNIGQFDIVNEGTLSFDAGMMYHRSSGSGNMAFAFSGSGDTTLSFIQRRTSSYDASIIINGPGTVTFTSGTNTVASGTEGFITGSTTVNGGTLRLNAEFNLGGSPAAFNPAQLTLNGGTLSAYATFTMDDENRGITFGPVASTVHVEDTHALTLATPVTGEGNLTKTGPGTLILSGASTHSGSTTVSAGILQVGLAGQGSSGAGATTIATGAQLTGTGTVQSSAFTLQSGATLQAGDITTGTLTGNGILTFAPEGVATFNFQAGSSTLLSLSTATNQADLALPFGGHSPGTPEYNAYLDSLTGIGSGSHDLLVFNGSAGSTLTFSGGLEVTATDFTPAYGQVYNLLDWSELLNADFSLFDAGVNRDGSGDDLAQFNLPDISASGFFWDVSRFTLSGTIAIIPEPSRALLVCLGLATTLMRRRRQV
ncbi:autotransporter-associated beta strand repeat-containing protein [Prosthecobacter sp. SYSU 5D2]|uniref:beta strand repeat-containing protein n=1 Tax=Prosthecobacter sp. SYSU 5D2 TaxID=3134134 RepID=UPI0031FE522D